MTLEKKKKKKKNLFEPTLNKSHELWLAFLLRLSQSLSAKLQPQPTSSDTTTAKRTIDGKLPRFFYIFFLYYIYTYFCFSYDNYFKFDHLSSHLNNYNVGYDCHNSSSSSSSIINRAAVLVAAATVAAVGCQQHRLKIRHVSSCWYVFQFFSFFYYTNVILGPLNASKHNSSTGSRCDVSSHSYPFYIFLLHLQLYKDGGTRYNKGARRRQ